MLYRNSIKKSVGDFKIKKEAIVESTNKDKEIISKIVMENGWVPNPLKLMEKRSGTVEKFMSYTNHV